MISGRKFLGAASAAALIFAASSLGSVTSASPAYNGYGPTYTTVGDYHGADYWSTKDWETDGAVPGSPSVCTTATGSGTYYIKGYFTSNKQPTGSGSPDYPADGSRHCYSIGVVGANTKFYVHVIPHDEFYKASAEAYYY